MRLVRSVSGVSARREASLALVALVSVGAGACGPGLKDDAVTQTEPILGGAADTTDDAVMALVHQMGTTGSEACSGTTIAKVGASGIFLTAGHCVVGTDGMGHITTPLTVAAPSDLYVLPGPDWVTSLKTGLYFGVTDVMTHPQYDGNVNSPFDIALVRYVGTTATTPVIPALAPAEDKLAVGSTITIVGFGKTETNTMNSQRREVDRVVQTLAAQQFVYGQTDLKGACQGDSGGPALVQTTGGVRVAGVTSFGDPNCTMLGGSVRVSSLSTFIQAFIDAAPKALDCGECTLAAVGPGNACVSQGATCGDMTSPCGQFLVCVDACQTQACVTSCRGRFGLGATAYDAMITCQCGNACTGVCATNPLCAPTSCGGLTDPRPACGACLQTQCCAEATACAAEATCSSCTARATTACRTDTAFSKLNTCLATCAACAASTPDAGTTTPDAGAPADAGPPPVAGKSGCACSAGGPASGTTSLGSGLLLAALLVGARRPRRVRRLPPVHRGT
jgi:hypothetical protein